MDITELAVELERALQAARADLEHCYPGIEPELMKDASGRYILLDAFAALALIRAAATR